MNYFVIRFKIWFLALHNKFKVTHESHISEVIMQNVS